MSEIKVCFAATNYGPLWQPVVDSWLRVVGKTSRYFAIEQLGSLGGIGITDRMYTHSAENAIANNFLHIEGSTHLFLTESDMILPDDCIIKLLEMDKDLASGVYFLRGGNGQPCLYRKVITMPGNPYPHAPISVFPEHEPFIADCPGLGCVLIKRRVFETLKFPWFDLKEATYGSDMYFYTKVKDAGFQTWCNPEVLCGQIEYKTWTISDYHDRLKSDSKYASTGYIVNPKEALGANGQAG